MPELTINTFPVNKLEFSDKTVYNDGCLSINNVELREMLLKEEGIRDVLINIARPGDSTRIVHVWDVIEPRTKTAGPGVIFPGWLGPPIGYGEGVIHRLSGMAVVTCTEFNSEGDKYTEQGEGIIDMSGPIAEMTPFSKINNLVIEFILDKKMNLDEQNKVVTRAGLKAAKYLADATVGKPAEKSEVRSIDKATPGLPNVVMIMVIAGSSPLLDTYVYGFSCVGIMPTFIHPNEMAEGALVACTGMVASPANTTYDFQNNPLIEKLYQHHGVRHNLAGVIIERGYAYEYNDKERLSAHAANLARFVKADGAIITSDSGGNIMVETMLACRECEKRGIKTALVLVEACGKDGTGLGLVDYVREADLIISVGNADAAINLPKMDTVYGGKNYIGTNLPGNFACDRILMDICGANSMLGTSRVRADDF